MWSCCMHCSVCDMVSNMHSLHPLFTACSSEHQSWSRGKHHPHLTRRSPGVPDRQSQWCGQLAAISAAEYIMVLWPWSQHVVGFTGCVWCGPAWWAWRYRLHDEYLSLSLSQHGDSKHSGRGTCVHVMNSEAAATCTCACIVATLEHCLFMYTSLAWFLQIFSLAIHCIYLECGTTWVSWCWQTASY